jgi:hypothetical protein
MGNYRLMTVEEPDWRGSVSQILCFLMQRHAKFREFKILEAT